MYIITLYINIYIYIDMEIQFFRFPGVMKIIYGWFSISLLSSCRVYGSNKKGYVSLFQTLCWESKHQGWVLGAIPLEMITMSPPATGPGER